MTTATDIGLASLVALMVTLLVAGFTRSAELAGREPEAARALGMRVAQVLVLWLGVTAVLAWSGVLSAWTARPPRLVLLPGTAFVTVVLVARAPAFKALVASLPAHWPIAAQTFRVGVELAIFTLYVDGRAPRQMTFEGRNFDVLVGLCAPTMAWLVARGKVTPAVVLLWNVAGLAVLANTIFTVITSVPGPIHLDWPGAPFTAVATWPVVWLPAFLAPTAIFLHLVSIRQVVGALRGNARA